MIVLHALLATLLPSVAPPIAPADDEALMDRIEALVTMPEGARRLADYRRSYAWDGGTRGHRRVIGVYYAFGEFEPGRHWVVQSELPVVFDGGCGLVTIIYDADADRIESAACNGPG